MSKIKKISIGLSCVAAVFIPMVTISLATNEKNDNMPIKYESNSQAIYNAENSINSYKVTKFEKHNQVVVPTTEIAPWNTRDMEQKSAEHMNLWPTHLYVTKGTKFEVEAKGKTDGTLKIFLDGSYHDFVINKHSNDDFKLTPGKRIVIEAPGDGVVYVRNDSKEFPLNVDIYKQNLNSYPVFTDGQTTDKEFLKELQTTKAPFAQITNGYTNFLWETRRMLEMYEKQNDPKLFSKVSKRFYDIGKYYSDNFGIDTSYTGVAKNHVEKLQVETSKNHGFGYAGYRVAVTPPHWPNSFFTDGYKSNWGLLHEIGHMWQNQNYKLDGWGESSNNMLITMYQKRASNNEYNRFLDKNVTKFLRRVESSFEEGKIPYNDKSIRGMQSMLMVEQLDTAFDGEFYPRFNQYYRTHFRARSIPNKDKLDHFVVAASHVVNRDLSPFFDKWGMKYNDESKAIMSELPKLENKIWNNYLYGNTIKNNIKEYTLPKYEPTNLPERLIPKDIVAYFNETHSELIERIKPRIQELVPKGYEVEAVISKDDKITSSKKISFNVFDPNNRYATENRFFMNVGVAPIEPLTTIGIGEWWTYGKKNRMKMQFIPGQNKIYFSGSINEKVLKADNAKISLRFIDPNGKLEKTILLDNTQTLKEILDTNQLKDGIKFIPGSTIEITKENFGRYVLLHTEPNHGHFYYDSKVILKLEGDAFVKK
ncbi:M60 family metallopeptidase [Mycoplasma marinum]|uniref:M60 family metallopeptidase n=1 Tax=Mycoplasma marinum TaxID=1937190 RepID=UPI003B369F65